MKRFILSLFFVLNISLFSNIIDIKNFDEALPHIKDNSLVILDVDNTLMEPQQELGNDQWFRYRVKKHLATGIDKEKAIDAAVSEWMSVQCVCLMQLVEPQLDNKVSAIQNRGIDVMGLTTRGFGMATRTIQQLGKLGISLSKNAPYAEEFIFENGHKCLFRGGILFTANSNKGLALEKFLNHTKLKPKHIVFINDKYSHLVPVDEKCAELEIPFIGLRYGYLDDKVENFNVEVAEKQWEHFNVILSDGEASRLLTLSKDS